MKGGTETLRQEKTSQDATNVNTSQSFCDILHVCTLLWFCCIVLFFKPQGVYKEV